MLACFLSSVNMITRRKGNKNKRSVCKGIRWENENINIILVFFLFEKQKSLINQAFLMKWLG